MIYLDSAATSFLKPPAVYGAVGRAMLQASSPGRGGYRSAMKAAEIVYRCREVAAELFHMDDPSRVVFCSNATHALNIAIHSLGAPGRRVLISGFEHNAVTRPLLAAGAQIRVAGRKMFDEEDLIKDFRTKIDGAELVVCTHVSNVFGFVLPIREIAALCLERGVPFIIDASQSAGLLDIDMPGLGADFIAMPGHKGLMGPQGTGLLLCARTGTPLIQGGAGLDSASPTMPEDLPEHLEAGTLNVPGIAGLLEGLRYVRQRDPATLLAREETLLGELLRGLRPLSAYKLFENRGGGQCGILSLVSDRMDSETLAMRLDQHHIAARAGLHCAPLAHESAGTKTMGTLRLSLSPFLEEEQIERAIEALRKII